MKRLLIASLPLIFLFSIGFAQVRWEGTGGQNYGKTEFSPVTPTKEQKGLPARGAPTAPREETLKNPVTLKNPATTRVGPSAPSRITTAPAPNTGVGVGAPAPARAAP